MKNSVLGLKQSFRFFTFYLYHAKFAVCFYGRNKDTPCYSDLCLVTQTLSMRNLTVLIVPTLPTRGSWHFDRFGSTYQSNVSPTNHPATEGVVHFFFIRSGLFFDIPVPAA